MDTQLADVTIHVDKALEFAERAGLEGKLRDTDGVVSVRNSDERTHLFLVEYNPDKVSSGNLLGIVRELHGHAELVGL